MILYTLYFIIFVFGLAVGSFLNAVIFRLEKGESVVLSSITICHPERKRRISLLKRFFGLRPQNDSREKKNSAILARSYCPHCHKILKWYDLVPVFSFLFLRGRCRYCKEKISIQYPIVELATGIMFAAIINYQLSIINEFSVFNLTIFNWASICYLLYIASVLIVIFVYDFKHYIIPDKILFPAIIISFIYLLFSVLNFGHWNLFGNWKLVIGNSSGILGYFFAAIIASGFFLILVLVSRGRWMGLGDVKLAFLMGLVLGWPDILVALFLAFAGGAVVGLALIALNRIRLPKPLERLRKPGKSKNYSLQSQIPFGPFLIAGTFVAMFWGGMLVNWYLHLLF